VGAGSEVGLEQMLVEFYVGVARRPGWRTVYCPAPALRCPVIGMRHPPENPSRGKRARRMISAQTFSEERALDWTIGREFAPSLGPGREE
jgi:hypothetical protein